MPETPTPTIDLTKPLPRGALPSPRSALAAAVPHVPDPKISAPPSFLMWPVQMSSWNNYIYGDCVSAEEAFAKACAAPQTFIPEATVVAWASAHGYLNGATLTGVMTTMQTTGFPLNNKKYDDGPYNAVDWTNAAILQSAIYSHGPVKIGVGAGDFQSNANGLVTPGTSGWAMYNYPKNQPEDHNTSLCGYGTLAELVSLFQQHSVTVNVPNGMPTGLCYAMFTWNSIGIIDEQSMLNMTYEAWIRNPVTIIIPLTGLPPVWMVPSPISGPAGNWSRGPDVFTAADVDGDRDVEIVISNNADGWTGVLKWNGSALAPIWMIPSPISGPAGTWKRGPDVFTAGDVNGDGCVEIVISNNSDGWTGVLQWNGKALVPIWMIPSPISGPAGTWRRGPDDFTAADVDGDGCVEIVISNNTDGWTGVLKWDGSALVPIWMIPSPISGPAGTWKRGPDVFTAGDVNGDGCVEIVISNNSDGWTGVLQWNGKALIPIWMVPSPIFGPAGNWSRGPDIFTAADVDGDGHKEILISNNTDGWTGVLKWNGSALAPVWMVPSPIYGNFGNWSRGPDIFTAADVDGDKLTELVISNNSDGWTGVLKWSV